MCDRGHSLSVAKPQMEDSSEDPTGAPLSKQPQCSNDERYHRASADGDSISP